MVVRPLALSAYAALVVFMWITAGAAAGLAVFACALVLTSSMRLNSVGHTITGWADRRYHAAAPARN